MARIYKPTDRMQFKIGEIIVKIAPLSRHQKNEVQKMMTKGQDKKDLMLLNDAIMLAISYCVKGISGVFDANNEPYQLEFDEGVLTEECISDLLNMEESKQLIQLCSEFVNGIPKKGAVAGVELIESVPVGEA